MDPKNLQINRMVRRIFVRHWIDLGYLSIRTVDGKVQLRGRVDRIAGVSEPLTGALLGSIISEIQRIREVIRVTAAFDNWTQDAGLWRLVETDPTPLDNLTRKPASVGMTVTLGGGTRPEDARDNTAFENPTT